MFVKSAKPINAREQTAGEEITVITFNNFIENGTNNKEGGRIDNLNSGIIQGHTYS